MQNGLPAPPAPPRPDGATVALAGGVFIAEWLALWGLSALIGLDPSLWVGLALALALNAGAYLATR